MIASMDSLIALVIALFLLLSVLSIENKLKQNAIELKNKLNAINKARECALLTDLIYLKGGIIPSDENCFSKENKMYYYGTKLSGVEFYNANTQTISGEKKFIWVDSIEHYK